MTPRRPAPDDRLTDPLFRLDFRPGPPLTPGAYRLRTADGAQHLVRVWAGRDGRLVAQLGRGVAPVGEIAGDWAGPLADLRPV